MASPSALFPREDYHRVVFQDISDRCDEAMLHELASQFGPVSSITWPTESTGAAQRKLFCFVDFYHPEDAKFCYRVCSQSHIRLFDKELRVHHVRTKTQSEVVGLHEIGAKLIVRNIDLTATEYDVRSLFEQFGELAAPPKMMRTPQGEFRGSAIISFTDFANSDRCLAEMHDRVFRNRIITVHYAEMEDGSGRLHGTAEERSNAQLIREEGLKYAAKVKEELAAAQKRQRTENTSWADRNF